MMGLRLCICSVCAILLCSASRMALAEEPHVPRVASSWEGRSIEVRPLDDPANPYLGQYGEWDRWLYAQWEPDRTYDIEQHRSEPFAPQKAYGMSVDAEGWLIPMLYRNPDTTDRESRTLLQYATEPRSIRRADRPETYGLWVYHPLPDKLYEQYMTESLREHVQDMPPIPAWLAQAAPLETIMLRSGEILCYGELGLRYERDDSDSWVFKAPGETWYRYSSEGQLLDSYPNSNCGVGAEWMHLYFEGLDEVIAEYRAQGCSPHYVGEYVSFARPVGQALLTAAAAPDASEQTKELLAAFRYDGTAVDAAGIRPLSTPAVRHLQQELLPQYYQAQLNLGLTSATSVSPWEGLPDGPQRSKDGIRTRPEVATRNEAGNEIRYVKVKALDDPLNPYAAEYTDWDRWLYGSTNKSEPRVEEAIESQLEEMNKAAIAGGDEHFKPLAGPADIPDDDWRWTEIIFDGRGFMLPIAHSAWYEYSRRKWLSSTTRTFSTSDWYAANGAAFMGAAEFAEYEKYRWHCVAERFPAIPEWLAAQPVMSAVFLDNGEVLTMGALGSWTDSDSQSDEMAQPSFEALWHRYSAQGELLAKGERGHDWPQFYSTALAEIEARAASGSRRVTCIDGYIYLRGRDEHQPSEVYDWQGNALEFSPALLDDNLYGEELSWEAIRNVRESRAAQ